MARQKTVAPGLTLGTLDTDSSADLTARMGVHNHADVLLERHAANWPVELTKALSLPQDDLRTEALDEEEVEDALLALKGRRAFYDEDDTLEGAAVRGRTDAERIVSVVFRRPSGRLAHGVIPYAGLTLSEAAHERLQEAKKGGVTAAPAAEVGAAEPAELAQAKTDAEAAETRAREAESAQRKADEATRELQERIAALENPEPVPGYAALNAGDRKKLVVDGGVAEYGRSGLERIEAWERSQENGGHKTVLDAIKGELAKTPANA